MTPLSFGQIRDIDPDRPASWQNRVFLTFDMEWAADEVIEDVLGLLEEAGAVATWFVTHETPILNRLRESSLFELGIHPNFNKWLFHGDAANGGTPDDIVGRLKELVPEAVSVRSHSLTRSSWIAQVFRRFGFRYESNYYVPAQSGMVLKPWHDEHDLVGVPYIWVDAHYVTQTFRERAVDILQQPGLKVFNFHPLHVAVNATSYDAYEQGKALQWQGKLHECTCSGYGVKSFLQDMIQAVHGATGKLSEKPFAEADTRREQRRQGVYK